MKNSDFEDVRRFIRLKRYEQPPEGFEAEFLVEFQRRQRAELLKRSSVSLFMERVGTYISGFGRQRLLAGAGLSYATAMLIFFVVSKEQRQPAPAAASVVPAAESGLTPVSSLLAPDVRLLDAPSTPFGDERIRLLPSGSPPIYQPRPIEPVRHEIDEAEIIEV